MNGHNSWQMPSKAYGETGSDSDLANLRRTFAPNMPAGTTLEMELGAAKETYEQLKSRYEQYLRKLERLKPEVEESRRYLVLLKEKSIEAAQKAPKKEAGRLIRRYPTHILRIIFEFAVLSTSKQRLTTATRISQVCRAWRNIAIQTPILWTQIEISMSSSIQGVVAMRDCLLERLQSKAPDVTLNDIILPINGVTQTVHEFMEACGFQQFKEIRTLQFRTGVSEDAAQLVEPAFTYTAGALESVIIKSQSISNNATNPVRLPQLIDNFPTVRHIALIKVHSISIGTTVLPESLQSLQIQQLHRPIAEFQLKSLTRLKKLTIVEVTFDSVNFSHNDITLNSLETLVVDQCSNVPWDRINSPSIKNLYLYNQADEDNSSVEYICRNPKLRHLVAKLTSDSFRQVALKLPNLEFLDIAGWYQGLFQWKDILLSSPPFPRLANLRINLTYNQSLSTEEFENIVKARCYPGPGLKRLATLHIADSLDRLDTAEWRRSRYLKKCIQTISRDGDWEKGIASVEMKWLR